MIKFNRFLLCALVAAPCGAWAAGGSTGFNMAAQLLSAARNGNTRLVQNLINSGADVNYVDSTGLSVVCTAVMNNDLRAVQVLQMYGADASNCDRQIKNYKNRTSPTPDSGLFAGLSSTHKLVLGVVGVGAVVGGLLWATDALDGGNNNSSNGGTGNHAGGGGSESGGSSDTNIGFTIPAGYCQDNQCLPSFWENLYGNGAYMANNGINYLTMIGAYNAFARGYLGLTTWRGTNNAPINLSNYTAPAGGKKPVLVAMVTKSGVNLEGSISSDIDIEYINTCNGTTCTSGSINKIYNNSTLASTVDFNLSSDSGVFVNALPSDTKLAKIISGYTSDVSGGNNDWVGVAPSSTLAVFKTGGQSVSNGYQNYHAMYNAVSISGYPVAAVVNLENVSGSELLDYYTVQSARSVVSSAATLDAKKTAYQTLINNKYNTANLTTETPAYYADLLFSSQDSPIIVMSAGNNVYNTYSIADATFENYVPAVYTNMEHLFATVVAVAKDTNNNLISLAAWDTDSDNVIDTVSRKCGVAGTGGAGIDPWCFAVPGMNDLEATATMAGAVGLLKGAFNYLTNEQIFTLLAVTADGAYLKTNPSTGAGWSNDSELLSYLQTKYELPSGYELTLENFKDFYGYGLINLDRATTPGKSVYYYSDGRIVSGNVYWRVASAQNHSSSVFGMRSATLPLSFYDVLTDVDNTVSLPRVWNMNLSLGNDVSHGLYMGDTLAELKTHDEDNTVSIGNLTFGFARSERAYDDNMSGVDNMSLAYDNERFGFRADYQHYLTDGAGRFTGLANPVLALASNAMTSNFVLHNGRFSLSGRGFIGSVTSEGLLENDPVVSANFAAAKLGDVMGAESGVKFNGERLSLTSNVGTMRESNTVLGAMWNGVLNSNGADTNYIDSTLAYKVTDDIGLSLRGTYAWTRANDIAGGVINGLSELKSNSFAAALRVGNFDLAVSMPLALTRGEMYYSYADFSVNNNNELLVNNAGEYAYDLTPDVREYRFNASYKHKFGDWTDGALGFIYRVNPNNTDAFSNESIFMMKLSHRLGI